MRILGIDPGAVDTGFVVRDGQDVIDQVTIHRLSDEAFGGRGVGVGPDYLERLEDTLRSLRLDHAVQLVGLECVVAPNPHVNRRNGKAVIDPKPLLGTAIALGHLHAVAAGSGPTVWVPPGKNGSNPLYAYPPALVSDAERRHGLNRIGDSGQLRHVRSAYDVAGQARTLARLLASKRAR